MGQFPIYKLKWHLLRTSVTACKIDKNSFSAPFGIFYVRMEIWRESFQKKNHTQTPNGMLLIFKLPFPNGSYRNGVCRALWALYLRVMEGVKQNGILGPIFKAYWGNRGREGSRKTQKVRRRCLWMVPYVKPLSLPILLFHLSIMLPTARFYHKL